MPHSPSPPPFLSPFVPLSGSDTRKQMITNRTPSFPRPLLAYMRSRARQQTFDSSPSSRPLARSPALPLHVVLQAMATRSLAQIAACLPRSPPSQRVFARSALPGARRGRPLVRPSVRRRKRRSERWEESQRQSAVSRWVLHRVCLCLCQ